MEEWSGFSFLQWLRGLDAEIPGDLTEETCLKLSVPPLESVYSRRDATSSIVIHHSASDDGSAAPFRVLHRAVFGWEDIGYHFVIGNGSFNGDGEVQPGRPPWAIGAHARSFNRESIGVCLVGNFEHARPSQAQAASLKELLETLMSEFSISMEAVLLHREVRSCSTACPGRNLDRCFLQEEIFVR